MTKNNERNKMKEREPQIARYDALVMVPVPKAISLKKLPLEELEEYFISKRDDESVFSLRKAYDTCRAVLKWASTCNGNVVECAIGRDDSGAPTVDFLFTFCSYEEIKAFEKDFKVCVYGAVG